MIERRRAIIGAIIFIVLRPASDAFYATERMTGLRHGFGFRQAGAAAYRCRASKFDYRGLPFDLPCGPRRSSYADIIFSGAAAHEFS